MFENELVVLLSNIYVCLAIILVAIGLMFYLTVTAIAKVYRALHGTHLLFQTEKGKLVDYNVTLTDYEKQLEQKEKTKRRETEEESRVRSVPSSSRVP